MLLSCLLHLRRSRNLTPSTIADCLYFKHRLQGHCSCGNLTGEQDKISLSFVNLELTCDTEQSPRLQKPCGHFGEYRPCIPLI
jgi:hypothetical protein